jgi:hypothetical protein
MATRSAVLNRGINKPLSRDLRSKMALGSGVRVPIPTFWVCATAAQATKPVKKVTSKSFLICRSNFFKQQIMYLNKTAFSLANSRFCPANNQVVHIRDKDGI